MSKLTAARKEWEKAQREKRIVDIARDVFIEKGFENTSMPAIADAAGYNKRTIYLYFKDKEDLFMAVVLHCLVLLREQLASVTHKIPADGAGLRAFADAFFGYARDYPGFMDLIMVYESRHFVYHDAARQKAVRNRWSACQAVSQEMADLATDALESAIQRGVLETDLPPRALMLVIWGQMLGVVKILRIRNKHFKSVFGLDQDELIDQFIGMMAASLAPDGLKPL